MQQPLVLNEDAILRALPHLNIRGALERMFQSLADGNAAQPPQTLSLFPNNAGDFITYLGVLSEQKVFGAKLSPYIPGDAGPLVTAWTVLMSMETGAPVLLCDSKRLTTERTAAATAIAVDRLARADSSVLTLVGTGAVGLAHLRHVEGLRNWTKIRLCSPVVDTQQGLPEQTSSGLPIEKVVDAGNAIDDADVVMLCTSSGTPVIDVTKAKPDALVTSISTNVANAHEIDPASLRDLDVYCDYRSTTPPSAGEMKLASASGTWSADLILGDLPELVSGRATLPTRKRTAFFRSIGLGLEDVAAAAALLDNYRS